MSERVLEVNGYSTFNDVEDGNVRIKNQTWNYTTAHTTGYTGNPY